MRAYKMAVLLAAGLLAGPALAQDKVVFATNWKAQAAHGGFYQAVADGTLLNREAAASHNITVRATSADGSSHVQSRGLGEVALPGVTPTP